MLRNSKSFTELRYILSKHIYVYHIGLSSESFLGVFQRDRFLFWFEVIIYDVVKIMWVQCTDYVLSGHSCNIIVSSIIVAADFTVIMACLAF